MDMKKIELELTDAMLVLGSPFIKPYDKGNARNIIANRLMTMRDRIVALEKERDELKRRYAGTQPQGDVIEPFNVDRARDPQWTLEYQLARDQSWRLGRFVGMHSDGNAVIEIDTSGVMARFTLDSLRMRKKQQTVQMFANLYRDTQGTYWGSLFPTAERAIKASAQHRGPVLADNVPVTITVVK